MFKRVLLTVLVLSAAACCDSVECGNKKFENVTVMSYDDGKVVILTSSDVDINIKMQNIDRINLSGFPEFNIAETYAKQKKLEDAARAYRDAYKKVPEILEQWRVKAQTLRDQGEKQLSKILDDSVDSQWIKQLIKLRYACVKRDLEKLTGHKPAAKEKSEPGDKEKKNDQPEITDDDKPKANDKEQPAENDKPKVLTLTEEEKLNPLLTPEALLYEFEKTLGVSQPVDPPVAFGKRWNAMTTLGKQQEQKRYAQVLEKYTEHVTLWAGKAVKWRIKVKDILPASLTSSGACEVIGQSAQGYGVTSLVPKKYQSHLGSVFAGEEVIVSGKIKTIEFDPARFTIDAEFIEIVSE